MNSGVVIIRGVRVREKPGQRGRRSREARYRGIVTALEYCMEEASMADVAVFHLLQEAYVEFYSRLEQLRGDLNVRV